MNSTWTQRKKSIYAGFCFIWVLTLLAGFMGRWSHVTMVLLPICSLALTVISVKNIISKTHGNICLGIGQLYCSLIFLMLSYKILYWQFVTSAWYLVGGIAVLALFDWFVLRKFIKNDKKIKETKKAHLLIFYLLIFLFTFIPYVYIKETFPSIVIGPNGVLSVVVGIAFAFISSAAGICNLVLEDDKLLYPSAE